MVIRYGITVFEEVSSTKMDGKVVSTVGKE
jgi:hypothetical protein